jgi:3-hydroxymyristoyl/3-hydroxydecanoyl-(acyl carrier protein) dehydratase
MKFRLVDQIHSWTPYQSIRGIKAVSFEEYCLKEAFGDEPHLPETLLLESFLQLGNWLIVLSSDFRQIGMVSRMSQVAFQDYLRPGQQLRMEVVFSRVRDDGFELAGEGKVNVRTIITGLGCLAVPVPAAEYVNPEDLRVLFSELYRPEPSTEP